MVVNDYSYIEEYLNVLMGITNNFSKEYISSTDGKKMLPIFRFAFEYILEWTPDEIYERLTVELLKKMKLYPLYKRMTEKDRRIIPGVCDDAKDCGFLAVLLYPDHFHVSEKDMALKAYIEVISGLRDKLPKHFIENKDGERNGKLCLLYAISKRGFHDAWESYEFFSNKSKTESFLKEMHLYPYYLRYFKPHPLDYLMNALPEDEKNLHIYFYYRLKKCFGEYEKKNAYCQADAH